jgi:pimeloyl-ACP methyl ester carboxylesterase
MATFVLVHGAWHGSWCWKRVRKHLQAEGHEVFTPTLTGVGERSHFISPQITLDTHVADIVNLLRWEELTDVVLCGHSYAGCVITGVADRVPERLRALVYLDAFILENGQSLHDVLPREVAEDQVRGAAETGDGWRVPPITAEFFRVNSRIAHGSTASARRSRSRRKHLLPRPRAQRLHPTLAVQRTHAYAP